MLGPNSREGKTLLKVFCGGERSPAHRNEELKYVNIAHCGRGQGVFIWTKKKKFTTSPAKIK